MYMTSYSLHWKITAAWRSCAHEKPAGATYCPVCGKKTDDPNTDIGNAIEACRNVPFDRFGLTKYEAAWDEREETMRNISKLFPGILFILHGAGEEQWDIWKDYYLNGLMYHSAAKIVFPPFDESLLK